MQQFGKQHLEKIFKDHFKNLVFFAVLYVKDMETAREIVQDAYIALWEKRPDIDVSKDIKSYLSTSIKNKCLNYLRFNSKFNRDLIEFEGLMTENEPAPDALFQADELSLKIEKLINELPEKCREIFLLNRYEGLKYKEIANQLDISVKTVEAQISKALQHLRENLRDYILAIIITIGISGATKLFSENNNIKANKKTTTEHIRVIHHSGVLFKN